MFFHQNNLLFVVNENEYRKFTSAYYALEKGWNAAQSFCDLNELFGEGTISKSQVERSSNRAMQTSQMKKEEEDHQISTIMHFWQS